MYIIVHSRCITGPAGLASICEHGYQLKNISHPLGINLSTQRLLDTPYTIHHTNLFWNELDPPGSLSWAHQRAWAVQLFIPGTILHYHVPHMCTTWRFYAQKYIPICQIISSVGKHTCDLLLDSWWMKTALPAATYMHTRSTGSVMVTSHNKINRITIRQNSCEVVSLSVPYNLIHDLKSKGFRT